MSWVLNVSMRKNALPGFLKTILLHRLQPAHQLLHAGFQVMDGGQMRLAGRPLLLKGGLQSGHLLNK